jgi:hypothetical protein
MNDYQLDQYCESIAQDIVRDARDLDQAMDWASESADSSEYVVYYHKAHELCQNCNTDQGEDFVAECWAGETMTYDEMACRIAYGEIDARVRGFVWKLWEEKEETAA